jgi:hypothetical protein
MVVYICPHVDWCYLPTDVHPQAPRKLASAETFHKAVQLWRGGRQRYPLYLLRLVVNQ